MSVLNFLKKTFSFDDRSMAFYRVFIGLMVVADVLYRWPDLVNFYTDIGLVPRSIFIGEMSMPWSLSFHLANGSYPFIVAMFAIHLILGVMLVFGYKTRWAMFGAYLMTVSVHNRNWLINNGGDDVLRAILFISIFLPLNRCFSIDSAMKKEKSETKEYFSTWVLVFFLQAFVIYYVGYILKDHPIWLKDYTAIFYSTRLDIFATRIGLWLRDLPGLAKLSTIFTIYLECFGPLLLVGAFIFGRRWWMVRTLVVLLFWGLHLGILATMTIGIFPFICMAMWSIFLPGELWDKIAAYYKRRNFDKLSIYYDAECGFCQKGVRLFREFLLFKEVKIAEAQSSPEIYSLMQKNHSWVIVNEKNEKSFQFSAWIELLKHSPIFHCFANFFALKPVFFIGQKIYVWISHHRPFMGKVTQFLNYTSHKKEIIWFKWVIEGFGIFIFVTLLAWNLTTIKKLDIKAPFFQSVTRWLHLYQEWNMFAPFPKTDNIWVEIPGVLSDGTEIELLTGDRDIYSIKDQAFYKQIPNEHWRKFYLNVSERADNSKYYGGYLCRLWNERHVQWVKGTTLRKLEIIVFSQVNLVDGSKGGIVRKLSWKHWCFDEDFKRENPPASH